jgi:hypothetical protein
MPSVVMEPAMVHGTKGAVTTSPLAGRPAPKDMLEAAGGKAAARPRLVRTHPGKKKGIAP